MVSGRPTGAMPRSDVVTGPIPDKAALLARVAASAAVAFVLILAAQHLLEPEFDPSWRFISEYQLGRWGWLMTCAFYSLMVSAGALLLSLASQIRTVGGYIGLILLAISTVGFARRILWVTGIAILGNLASFAQQGIIAVGAGSFGPDVPVGWPNRILILAFAGWLCAMSLLVLTMHATQHPGPIRASAPSRVGGPVSP